MLPIKPEDWPRCFAQYLSEGNLEVVKVVVIDDLAMLTPTGGPART
jgi:hypothetical protein